MHTVLPQRRIEDKQRQWYVAGMSPTAQAVREEAMSLSLSERASLAHDLILSLDDPAAFDLGVKQETEIARRVQMVREGTAKGRPAADVFHDIKAKYGR